MVINRCGCGNIAEYAVYMPPKPHCRTCMLEAVDVAVAIEVRTMDPWEQFPPTGKVNAPGGNQEH